MPVEVRVPRLGWSMEEGTLVEWLKRDGEWVQPGEYLFVLEGDKASNEVEAFDEGHLHILPDGPGEGDPVRVGDLLGYLLAEGEVAPERPSDAEGIAPVPPTSMPAEGERIADASTQRPAASRVRISPRAKRVAAELGIEWQSLSGGGTSGRIREVDVRRAADANGEIQPLEPTRRTLVQRLSESARETVPVTLTTRADATAWVELRQAYAENSWRPSYNDLFIKLVAMALRDHPLLQAQLQAAGLRFPKHSHIALAVDTERGLVAPVVRDADQKSLETIVAERTKLVERAKAGKLQASDGQGATFTISNLGAYGVDAFTPVITPPQCAILGVGALRREPVVVEDSVVPRDVLTLSLTFDHRIADGVPAARFLAQIRDGVESPPPYLQDT